MNTVLTLKNVTKKMGKNVLVEDISLEINKGEIFGFLGPNGAGKTTTIKMITGLYSITEGEIYIAGKSVRHDFEKALEGVGGIIENPEMYGYMSGRDNLKVYARMHGNISKAHIKEVANLVKLGKRIDDKVSTYSLGMRQRLGLAQALLHNPQLLILDEPTNGLDPMGIKELRETLRELATRSGLAVLVSSHLLTEMELMCDRFGIIDGGKMIGIKTLDDIKKTQEKNENTYLIDVADINQAAVIIERMGQVQKIERTSEGIKVVASKQMLATINKTLIQNNVDVYGTSVIQTTLEDEFMKVTEGSKGQIR